MPNTQKPRGFSDVESRTAQDLLQEAKAALQEGRLSNVEQLCSHVLAREPESVDALNMLGIVSAQTQRPAQAIELFAKAATLAPGRADLQGNLGNVLHDLKRLDEALESFDRALQISPDNAQAHYYRGIVLRDLGRHNEALACFDKTAQLNPHDAELQYQRGVALQSLERNEEAVLAFERALVIRPQYADALQRLGIILCNLRRYEQALESLHQVLQINPQDTIVLVHRGVALSALGQPSNALESFRAALQKNPSDFNALCGQCSALHALKQYDEALASNTKAIVIDPSSAQALCARGAILDDIGQHLEAQECANKALQWNAAYADGYYVLGRALMHLGQSMAAVQAFEHAAALEPHHLHALASRGALLSQLGRQEEALACFEQILQIAPLHGDALCNRGELLRLLNRRPEALQSIDQALAVDPASSEAYYRKGLVLHDLNREHEALQCYEHALSLAPDNDVTLNNQGVSLAALGRYEDALASYERALELAPCKASIWRNRGVALADLGRHPEAITSLRQALFHEQDNIDAAWNLALCNLRCANFAEGWQGHENRWQATHLSAKRREFSQPLWLGEPSIQGKTILLHYEQGLGDTLQFCRYVKLVNQLGAKVILELQAPLFKLLSHLPGAAQVILKDSELPPFDVHCPLMSLPLAFKTGLATIPADVPYIGSDARQVSKWQGRIGARTRIRIGLAWSGNPDHGSDRSRSVPLHQLLPLLRHGVDWICLQKDIRETDRSLLATRADIQYFGPLLEDFTDTAALMELVDLVISIDTSLAHLAGAMGKPVWVLLAFNPDWRWLLARNDSPWYPTARLFRQSKPGNWQSVLDEAAAALSEWLPKNGQQKPSIAIAPSDESGSVATGDNVTRTVASTAYTRVAIRRYLIYAVIATAVILLVAIFAR